MGSPELAKESGHEARHAGVLADETRPQFELWAKIQGYSIETIPCGNGRRVYVNAKTLIAWRAWRAAIKLAYLGF